MDPLLVQRTRYILKSRFRRAQTCPANLLPATTAQVMAWLESHPIMLSILARLRTIETNAAAEVDDVLKIVKKEPFTPEERVYDALSPEAHAAICLRVVEGVAALHAFNQYQAQQGLMGFAQYLLEREIYKPDEAVEAVRDVALDGLCEYMDEQLDTDSALYAVMLKYKQHSEWFYRNRLMAYAEEGLEGKTGERALAIDLYDYLLGQGLDFTIEQTSASGEVDLLLSNSDGRRLVIDAKYIKVGSNRSAIVRKLADGLHQVARYCNDYAEPAGFLVTFIATHNRLAPELKQRDGLDYIEIGGRTIYYLPIYIGDEPSASKSGKAEEVVVSKS